MPDSSSTDKYSSLTTEDLTRLGALIKEWGKEFGFQDVGITDLDLKAHPTHLKNWLANNYHGEMGFMADHGDKRYTPEHLVPGTARIISVRMDYLPQSISTIDVLENKNLGYISRYTLGRDYHKLIRKRLAQLGKRIEQHVDQLGFRAFVDSAPVLERAIAEKSGLGWIGKNTMLIHPKAGSWFFLGELFTDLPLPIDSPFDGHHCGSCQACLDVCPTQAFVGPQVLDARKCISYLTIELDGPIPEPLRKPMGNRIFGCDDCQLYCPFNKFSTPTKEDDFTPRHQLDKQQLIDLFAWDEATFLAKTEGSAIRRTGYINWLRNIAVALGNAPTSIDTIEALKLREHHESELVREHVRWALDQHHS